jgi:DNA-directed RNA polymerase subunit M/transcription elongation factor TFIIS
VDKATCAAQEGCDRRAICKGLCKKHYMAERGKRLGQQKCKTEGCDNPQGQNAGYCPACYQRLRAYGDPLAGPPRRKRRTPSKKVGTRSTYHVNHQMVRKERGPAWQQKCEHCGARAKQWATIHGRSGASPDDYMPLCGSCHHKYDGLVANLPDNIGSKRTPEAKQRMRDAANRRWATPGAREKMSEVARRREARKREPKEGHHG